MRSAYRTHLPVLNHILSTCSVKRVIEFGPGDYSTPLFVQQCEMVQCIEMQSEQWYNKVKQSNANKDNFSIICSLSATGFYNLEYIDRVDLVFVDGHGESRPEVINFFNNKSPIIVVHDTEDSSYGWARIKLDPSYDRFDYKKVRPNTTVFSTNDLLLKSLFAI